MTDNRSPLHFFYLFLLALFWGSAFMFNKVAVDSIPPLTIAAGRIFIGALIVTGLALKMGAKLPRGRDQWVQCLVIGILGNVIPFFLVSWAVQHVQSALAAICMSLMPLFTLALAHVMTHDEKFSVQKLIGVIFGVLGIVSLFYGTIREVTPSLTLYLALFGLLATSFFYALCGVLIKNLKNKNPLSTSAAMLIMASVVIIPLALMLEHPWTATPTVDALVATVMLGVFSTGLAAYVLFHLTHITGAVFVSYNTYLIPLVGMAAGYIWLDEALKSTYFISICFIFTGIYLAERRKSVPHPVS
ncbi:DMT family transporter [Paremcibacter congregatus]|uniref:DMT family transporter n=1 Tax=Paremcibacter congregatus TaxID=2043170 RepID=UPI0030ED7417|tara:strand:+ start:3287 stop:4192 length:906 start_codon:yes stop_codon:yes gene_type:complete